MIIQLTPQQLSQLDSDGDSPPRFLDPRTNSAYVLVPEVDYVSMREMIEEEKVQALIRTTGLRNAAARMTSDS